MNRKILLLSLSFLLLGLLVFFSNPLKVGEVLLNANPLYILLGLLLWFVGALVRTYRWNYLLDSLNMKVGFWDAFKLETVGMALSNLTPLKTGDPVKSVLLKKTYNKPFSQSVSTIFIERILDILSLVIIALIGIGFLSLASETFNYIALALFIYITAIGFFLYLTLSKNKLEKFFSRLTSWFGFIPKVKSLEKNASYFSKNFRNSLRKYKKKSLAWSFLTTFGIWLLGGLSGLTVYMAVGLDIPYLLILFVMSSTILISVLVFLPGSIGSGEIISVYLFTQFLAVSVSSLTAGVLVSRVINFWLYILLGFILLNLMGVDFRGSQDK